jgi:hypothetical protein
VKRDGLYAYERPDGEVAIVQWHQERIVEILGTVTRTPPKRARVRRLADSMAAWRYEIERRRFETFLLELHRRQND